MDTLPSSRPPAGSPRGLAALHRATACALALAALAGCRPAPSPAPAAFAPSPAYGDSFWTRWGDGRAEMAAYDLTTPRYGALRRGTAVVILVTETFSNEARVKADPGRHPKRDEFPVLKLNLVEDFATGIYDYNLLTSAFVALAPVNGRPAGAPTKVSFSAQEWCGHTYAQLLFDHRYARFTLHSYFDGEADSVASFPMPADAQTEDALLVWAHGLAWPLVAPGDSVEADVVGSLRTSRLRHEPLPVAPARFRRSSGTEPVTVPAGRFTADVATVTLADGRLWRFWTDHEPPHRLLRWTCSDGTLAELLGADRLAYWTMNGPRGDSALVRLGLRPRAPRMP